MQKKTEPTLVAISEKTYIITGVSPLVYSLMNLNAKRTNEETAYSKDVKYYIQNKYGDVIKIYNNSKMTPEMLLKKAQEEEKKYSF